MSDASEWRACKSKLVHVGYMDAHFKTREDAASYYDRHNAHMRPMNAQGTWASDWDPVTRLKYVVRQDLLVASSIEPFDPDDASTLTADRSHAIWRWCK